MRSNVVGLLKVLGLSLSILATLPVCARGDIVTFFDLNDIVTSTDTTGGRVPAPCLGLVEGCSLILNSPIGFSSPDLSSAIGIGEPFGNGVSDSLQILNLSPNQFQILFLSDNDPKSLGTCPPAGCSIVEDGTVQTAATITWIGPNGSTVVDLIKFQSDVAETPEPTFGVLCLMGLFLMAAIACRRHRNASRSPAR